MVHGSNQLWLCAGRALALELASRGVQVTIVDLKAEPGQESVRLVEAEHARISFKPPNSQPSALFVQCDVTKTGEIDRDANVNDRTGYSNELSDDCFGW